MKEDAAGWALAERNEMANHASNKSFTMLTQSEFERAAPGRRLIRLLWVYARKRSGRLKARLCVQGCAQMPVTDFDQTFSATLRHSSLRILSAIAAQTNFLMRRWDFVSAYLQGELEEGETVYCSAPPGPYSQQGEDGHPKVWRVDRPIYGLAQAGRRWQRSLFDWLKSWGLRQCEQDPCVFVLHKNVPTPGGPREDSLIVECYVDDLYVLYNSGDKESLYTQFTQALQKRWSVEDEGEVADLLNVEITQVDGGVELRQTAYIYILTSCSPLGCRMDYRLASR